MGQRPSEFDGPALIDVWLSVVERLARGIEGASNSFVYQKHGSPPERFYQSCKQRLYNTCYGKHAKCTINIMNLEYQKHPVTPETARGGIDIHVIPV